MMIEIGDELFVLAYVLLDPKQERCEPKIYHCKHEEKE